MTGTGSAANSAGALWDEAAPSAAALIESLRGVGYTPAAAIADLLDNSITAGAGRAWLNMQWAGASSRVALLDDGEGMEEAELVAAMRPGSRSPRDSRQPGDLGRFGLGLKTASFSQARRLTVATKKTGCVSIRRWDLDHVVAVDEWQLLHGTHPQTEPALLESLVTLDHGTLVIWENLDRLLGQGIEHDVGAADRFYALCENVERHLAMVFHRFLELPRPTLALYMNGRTERSRVKGWDPFLRNHGATWSSPVEIIRSTEGPAEIQGYVLPHQDRLSPVEFGEAGGPEGWLAQEGFYVYRNMRLLSSGGWMDLGSPRAWTREEPYKLARIRVDITNAQDSSWRVDIKKSAVHPPDGIRSRLRDLAERVREQARRVFVYRGSPARRTTVDAPVERLWVGGGNANVYRIDRNNPLVAAARDNADLVEALLVAIERSVPVQRIWLDITDNGPPAQRDGIPSDEVRRAAHVLYRNFRLRAQLSEDDARRKLLRLEPFDLYPEFINGLADDLMDA